MTLKVIRDSDIKPRSTLVGLAEEAMREIVANSEYWSRRVEIRSLPKDRISRQRDARINLVRKFGRPEECGFVFEVLTSADDERSILSLRYEPTRLLSERNAS
jgi:hypothetical protein